MIAGLRPKFDLLSPALVDRILDEAYSILERTGVFFENPEARSLFREAGQEADEKTQRVRLSPRLVDRCLATTPAAFDLFDRQGDISWRIGGDEVHFDPGSSGTRILDHITGRERKPLTADLVSIARLTDALTHLHFQSTALVPFDVPGEIADDYRLYLALLFSAKPVVTGTFRIAGFGPMRDMLAAVRGGAENLRAKPLAIFDACPSPPLRWSRLTSQSLIDCARAGIPSELISMGMTGATSPATITGTLVQHVVENLAGLCLAQIARPGAPVIFGGSPSSFDMRRGTCPMGAMETMMIDCAYAQLGKRLRLPTHAYMALSDAKTNDAQAGFETGIGAVLAALAGINVVSGPGMMDYESTISLEKMVIDDEICALAYRLISGIVPREDSLAEHLFEDFGPETDFLKSAHTRKWYRAEHLLPIVADRDPYDAWEAKGGRSIADRASDRVNDLLAKNTPPLPDPALTDELRRIMAADAGANGVTDLPALPVF
ncbi:MAG: trimethylamine methyltransferase family protein [Candidatus Aminicenantes bacterium]|nr:trimethylamine methyltransferase family protein [Candidatus Aminicenantes bacterium]